MPQSMTDADRRSGCGAESGTNIGGETMAKYTEWEQAERLEQIRQWVKAGLSDAKIAERIGTDKGTLSRWRRRRPLIRQALTRLTLVDGRPVDRHDLSKGGRRKLTNVAELESKVNQWLEECKREDRPLTKTGLCLYLDISKQALNNYINQCHDETTVYRADDLSDRLRPVSIGTVLKGAIMAIEDDIVTRMLEGKGNVAGAIFYLKNNHGYADKTEVNAVNTNKTIRTDDEIDKRIKELQDKAGIHIV